MLVLMKSSIHHFHTDSNAYFLPPKILHYSRPNRNRRHWLCKILGVNKVHYGLFENNKFVPRERMYVCTSVKGGWGGGGLKCLTYNLKSARHIQIVSHLVPRVLPTSKKPEDSGYKIDLCLTGYYMG